MNTKQLPYILAIASTGSLSRAARQLHISQPALSKYLAELERQVGMDLFLRYKKRLYPTPAGKLYLKAAREILQLEIRTRDMLSMLNSPEMTELHIGVSPHRGALLMAEIFPGFNQQFPQIRLIPHEGYGLTLQGMMKQGIISLAATSCGGALGEDLAFLGIFREEVILGVPGFHRMAQKYENRDRTQNGLSSYPYVDLEEFRESTFVMSEEPSVLAAVTNPLFEQAGFHPLTAFSSPNIIFVEAMIRSGAGVGFLPASYGRSGEEMAYFRLRHPVYLESGVLYRKNHVFSEAERYLIFLQMKNNVRNPNYEILWENPYLREITKEFHDQCYPFSRKG